MLEPLDRIRLGAFVTCRNIYHCQGTVDSHDSISDHTGYDHSWAWLTARIPSLQYADKSQIDQAIRYWTTGRENKQDVLGCLVVVGCRHYDMPWSGLLHLRLRYSVYR